MNRRNRNITSYFVILALLLIGVVYAILQANLQINGIAKIKSNTWDIHFTNIQVNENSVSIGTGDSAATIDPENNCKVDFEVTLGVPGDFYEFLIDVVNTGTIDGMIGEIQKSITVNGTAVSELPYYLNYDVTFDDGEPITQNYLLAVGETLTFKVRLEFRTDIEELPDTSTISASLTPQYVQADSGAIKKRLYHPCTYDGELVQGAEFTDGQYTYRYMQEVTNYSNNVNTWSNISTDGWGVRLTDPTSTDPVTTTMCVTINDKPIVSMSYMYYRSQATSIDTTKIDTSHVTNMTSMFNNCRSLTSIDLSKFETENVTDMSYMFYYCVGLPTINVSYLDTSSVSYMSGMFGDCSNLESIDIRNFDLSHVSYMTVMFQNDIKLTSLDFSNLNFSHVPSGGAGSLCQGCTSLTEVKLDNVVFNNIYSLYGLLNGATSLKKISAKNWKISTSVDHGFITGLSASSSSVEEINVSGWTFTNSVYLKNIFGYATNLKTIVGLDSWNFSNITGLENMFYNCSSLTSINLSNFNTSHVTNMASMFYGCSGLTSIDLTHLNTSSVTNMSGMFYGCTGLTSIDLSPLNTSNVTNMAGMFQNCTSLTTLDLSPLNTSNVTTMGGMISGCSHITTVNMSNLDLRKLSGQGFFSNFIGGNSSAVRTINMTNVTFPSNCTGFFSYSSLSQIILTNANTSNVTNMTAMFDSCSNLTSLDLSSFNTSNVTNMASMFNGCSGLTSLDLSSFDTSNVSNLGGMFSGCSSVTTAYAKTQADADRLNASGGKPSSFTFVLKP